MGWFFPSGLQNGGTLKTSTLSPLPCPRHILNTSTCLALINIAWLADWLWKQSSGKQKKKKRHMLSLFTEEYWVNTFQLADFLQNLWIFYNLIKLSVMTIVQTWNKQHRDWEQGLHLIGRMDLDFMPMEPVSRKTSMFAARLLRLPSSFAEDFAVHWLLITVGHKKVTSLNWDMLQV